MQQIVMGCIVGFIFSDLDYDDSASRYGLLFLASMNFGAFPCC